MKKGIELVTQFQQRTAGHSLWPPLHNMKPFFQVSGWNASNLFDALYTDRTPFPLLIITTPEKSAVYLSEEKPLHLAREIFAQHLQGLIVLSERQKLFVANKRQMDALYQTYNQQTLATMSEAELLYLLQKVNRLLWLTNTALFFTLSFDREVITTLHPKGIKDAVWDVLTNPVEESFDQAAQRAFLGYVAQGLQGDELAEACQYMFTSYSAVYSIGEITGKLTEKFPQELFQPEVAQKSLQQMDVVLEDKRRQREVFKKNHKQDEQNINEFIEAVITLRDQRKGFLAKGQTVCWRIAERLADLAQMPHAYLPHITHHELCKGVQYLSTHSDHFNKRIRGSVMYVDADGAVTITHQGAAEALTMMQSHHERLQGIDRAAKSISGQIGSRGVVEGIVRIVFDPEKAEHFTEGDILVTGMTRPEFVPLMGRASAIITDEGGVTCHAAIISREMRMPCIIGTKIGTMVLRDGERVRVDAENGCVYRLDGR